LGVPELAAACFGLQKSKCEKLLRFSASPDGIKGCGTRSHRASENGKGNPKFARTGIETEQLQALASDGMQMVVNGHSGEEALADMRPLGPMPASRCGSCNKEHARYMPSRQGASRRS
jgi:hypothetical protein